MATEFDQLWADALSTFSVTTDSQLDDISLPLLTTLDDLKLELSKRQESFSEFRRKRHDIFEALSEALGPIQMLANIAAGGLSNAFPPSGVAFNAFSYMIGAAGNVSASYDSVCDLLAELAQFTTRLAVHARQDIPAELRGIVIEILCALIKLCGYAGKLMKHGRVSEYFKKLYLGKDKDVAEQIATLQRLTKTEARMVGALALAATNRTEKQINSAVIVLSEVNVGVQDVNLGISELRDQVSSLAVKMNELNTDDRSDVEQKQLDKIRLVLSPSVTPEEIYRAISGKREPGTGDWMHDERLFKAWLDREKPVLWISGGPGSGKSYLSSNIIHLLTQLHPQRVQASSRISIAYYFCKDYDPELRSFNKALRTLAFQICQNDPIFAKYVAGVCKFPEDIRTTESLWQKLFVEFYSGQDVQSMVYIVIDGMDEAFENERSGFLELLKSLQKGIADGHKTRVQILMVGRPELSYDIENVLEGNLPTISVNAVKNSADIEQYVTTKVSKERNLRRISKALHDKIVSELTKRADGMFLWVDLMLKEVASKHKEVQMHQALNEAPSGLFNTIQRALDRMYQELSIEDARDFNTLLSWVTCAKRPFSLGELERILKLTSDEGESVVYLEGELRKRYASFFNVNREDGRSTEDLQMEHLLVLADEDDPTGFAGEAVKVVNHDTGLVDDFGEDMDIDSNPVTTEVTLAHASFGDFFRKPKAAGKNSTDIKMWSLQITKHLLRLLCEEETPERWINNSFSLDSLSAYAAVYWQDHLRDVDFDNTSHEDRTEIGQKLISMFRHEDTLRMWGGTSINTNHFRQAWVYTDDNIETAKKWLGTISSQLPEGDITDLMSNVTDCFARAWLKKGGLELGWPERSFMAIRAYQAKIEATKTNAVFPKITDYEASDLAHNSPETIIEVARSFKFEEDSNWNARLGRVLRQAGHYEIAKFYLEKAVSLAGPTERFRSLTGLGLLFDGQENYKDAIDAVERGLKAAKEDPSTSETEKTRIRRLWTPQLLRWYHILKELDSGISLGREMLESFPEQYASATRYIQMLVDAKQYETAMEVLRKASQETIAAKECTRLSDWCIEMMWKSRWEVDFYSALVTMCRAMNDLEFARTTYLDALKAAPKTDPDIPLLLQADYATLLLREFRKPKRAAHMLEMILEDVKKGRKDSASALVRIVVVDLLCEIYSSRAIIGGKNSKEAVSAMEKLANIWNQQPKSREDPTEDIFEGDVFMTTRNSTLCLASLYRAFGEPEKGRQFFKDHLKLGFDLLTDDDPENDWEGYRKICETLSRAGDNINALAAQALVCPKLIPDDSPTPSAPGGTIPLPVGAQELFSAVCDGCETANEYASEKMYCCLFCVDISFDEGCYKLLMEDKLPFKICGKEHEFFYVPELKPFPKGSVPVDGKIVPVKEWLADVRKQWAI